jgi:hypothetical protein
MSRAPSADFTSTPFTKQFQKDCAALRDKLASLKWHIVENTVNKEIIVDLIEECQRLSRGSAQTQQEPVAWRVKNDFGHWYITQDKALADTYRDIEGKDVQPLYLSVAQQPAHCDICRKAFEPDDDVVLLPSRGNYHQSCYLKRHAQEAQLSREHIIRVVLQAYGFTDHTLDDLTWLRNTHAYAVASRVADALAD